LDSYKTQLARIDSVLKDRLPTLHDNTAALAQARQELTALENQYWEKRKQEARAISELDLVKNLLSSTFDEMDKAKEQLIILEMQKRQLDASGSPAIQRIQVNGDGQALYAAEWKGPFDELQQLDQEIKEMKAAVEILKTGKTESFNDFKAKFQEGTDILTQLHGNNVSQGNGVWATLKDVASNDGMIMHNARGQAAVDFGINAYEVFVEGWGRGGPAGALIETMHKVASAGIQMGLEDASGVLDSGNFTYQDTVSNANTQFNAGISDPLTAAEIAKTGIYRTIEDGLTRHARDFGNETLGVQMAKKFARPDRVNFAKMMTDRTLSASALRSQGEKLNLHRKRIMQLGQRETFNGKSLGASLVKDAIKTAAKAYFQGQENALWEDLLVANAAQTILYRNYKETAEKYWVAYDELEKLKKQRADLVLGYNPQSGFKVLTSKPFNDKVKLHIQVSLHQPQGHQEAVSLNGVPAQSATAPHEFQLEARTLPHAENPNPSPIDIQIQQL
jgi:hypothetical protein